MKDRAAILCGIGISIPGSAMTALVMGNGEEAYERYRDGPVTTYLDADFDKAFEQHEHVAHQYLKIMYLLLIASLAAGMIAFLKPAWLLYATILVALPCLCSVVSGLVIADSGSEIRRPDFRN